MVRFGLQGTVFGTLLKIWKFILLSFLSWMGKKPFFLFVLPIYMNKFMSFSGPREHSHWKKKYGQGTFFFVFSLLYRLSDKKISRRSGLLFFCWGKTGYPTWKIGGNALREERLCARQSRRERLWSFLYIFKIRENGFCGEIYTKDTHREKLIEF